MVPKFPNMKSLACLIWGVMFVGAKLAFFHGSLHTLRDRSLRRYPSAIPYGHPAGKCHGIELLSCEEKVTLEEQLWKGHR